MNENLVVPFPVICPCLLRTNRLSAQVATTAAYEWTCSHCEAAKHILGALGSASTPVAVAAWRHLLESGNLCDPMSDLPQADSCDGTGQGITKTVQLMSMNVRKVLLIQAWEAVVNQLADSGFDGALGALPAQLHQQVS